MRMRRRNQARRRLPHPRKPISPTKSPASLLLLKRRRLRMRMMRRRMMMRRKMMMRRRRKMMRNQLQKQGTRESLKLESKEIRRGSLVASTMICGSTLATSQLTVPMNPWLLT